VVVTVVVVVEAGRVRVEVLVTVDVAVLVAVEVTVDVTIVVTGGSVTVDVLEVVVVGPCDPQRAVPAARVPMEPPTTISLFRMLEDCAFPSTPQLVP
jgi:hypothetical protein